MTQTIHLLDSLTIDKIAAGEVIESPASCVKELIDNAIDAGATSLLIEMQLGGRELIVVQDNGKGMSEEDLLLSCRRHATSKIRSIEDLDTLTSRGFRGEALSSITSISKVTIRSRERDNTDSSAVGQGDELSIEGGKELCLRKVTAPHGTQVTVKDLFFNVPARRKFLKSPAKNGLEILKTVKQLALISPNVSFTLISDKKTLFQVAPHTSFQERAKAVVHEPYLSSSLSLSFQKEGLSIEGLLVLPEQAKKNRSGQHIFVNGRPISSVMISFTMKMAYATSLRTDEYPQFVLSLEIDPERVDMNVHPQKKEVRFADEEWLRTELYDAVSKALFSTTGIPQEKMNAHEPKEAPSFHFDEKLSSPFIFTPKKTERYYPSTPLFEEISLKEPETHTPIGNFFQYHVQMGPYSLVTIHNKGVVLIHLTQALLATLSKVIQKECTSSQLLLNPEIIELGSLERECIEEKLPYFTERGFTLSQFGTSSLLLEAIPSSLDAKMALVFVKELIENEIIGEEPLSEKVQARFHKACLHSYPELDEGVIDHSLATKIIDNWLQAGAPPCTLYGKKVYIPLEKKSLEALFEKLI